MGEWGYGGMSGWGTRKSDEHETSQALFPQERRLSEGSVKPVGRESPRAQIRIPKGCKRRWQPVCSNPDRPPGMLNTAGSRVFLPLLQSVGMGSRGLSPHRRYDPSGRHAPSRDSTVLGAVHLHLFKNTSSRFNNTLPTTVQAARSTTSMPTGSGPSGSSAICFAAAGSLANLARVVS